SDRVLWYGVIKDYGDLRTLSLDDKRRCILTHGENPREQPISVNVICCSPVSLSRSPVPRSVAIFSPESKGVSGEKREYHSPSRLTARTRDQRECDLLLARLIDALACSSIGGGIIARVKGCLGLVESMASPPSVNEQKAMKWDKESTLKLIEMYEAHPELWNCLLKEYRDRDKKAQAKLEENGII
ncbi:unnamed protein product, partial [Acanthoscelides obtectus]